MKKIVIIGAVLLILAIVVFFVFFLSFKKPISQQSNSSPEISPVNSLGNSKHQISVQLKQSINPAFSVSYPDSWIVDQRSIVNGGTAFTSRVNSTDTFFPRFEVQATPISGQSMEDKIKNLSFYNLPRTETTFKGRPATKLAGKLNLHFITGNPQQKPVYKVFLFVPTTTTLYTISYAYFDDENRVQSEVLAQKMLDNLELH